MRGFGIDPYDDESADQYRAEANQYKDEARRLREEIDSLRMQLESAQKAIEISRARRLSLMKRLAKYEETGEYPCSR